MKFSRSIRKFRRLRHSGPPRPAFARVQDELRARTKAFIAASNLRSRTTALGLLFRCIWGGSNDRAFTARLIRWVRLLEHDDLLRIDFQEAFQSMLADLDSVSLFAEAGLPAHHAVFSEGLRRIVQRFLPSARAESDISRLLLALFASSRDVERFLELPDYLFVRLCALLWPSAGAFVGSPKPTPRIQSDLREALCLLAMRTAGRGVTTAIRERGSGNRVEGSPFYQLVFSTEQLVRSSDANSAITALAHWNACLDRCREELDLVHSHMESAGVSADLVLDLRSIEMGMTRMQHLAGLLYIDNSPARDRSEAVRNLLNQLIEGRLEDKRLSSLLKQNLNLLARKTVERTGHSGEHYIAHTRKEYWQMWLASLGGGLLTVLTAAFKMRIVEQQFPLFVEGFLTGTNYAISFILLQVFGLALATKQPSATAATFAGIVRKNRGVARWSKIADFTAHISRSQLASAVANIIAVCAGAVAFERLWRVMFSESYLPAQSAKHVYQTLHPFTSGTVFYAAITGVILWLAALIGGWCENFAIYHRITEAVSQHPVGFRVGESRMKGLANWMERNLAGWSTSIALGYLLGFVPVIARFFGIPLDVRHVTLSTGTLALAAARFGTASFGHDWFYYAVAGIAATFVLNLGVSFSIASFVALRAYDVRGKEQMQLLRYLLRQIVRSPLKFLIPIDDHRRPTSALSGLLEEE